ncbi:endonuclease MutS2 [Candidatus Acetothermia bacterium]|nr:endonuclease MutS2 [Candidatus Acetothermia bacterium]
MFITNEKTLRDLEYAKLKEILKEYASSDLGRDLIEKLRPSAEQATIELELVRVAEMRSALRETHLGLNGISDLRPILHHAHETTSLPGEEFLAILQTLEALRLLKENLENLEKFPKLQELGERIGVFRELEEFLRRVLDEEGEIKENASPKLRELSVQKRILEERVQKKLRAMLQSSEFSELLQDGIITRRSSRLVIPIKSSAKHEIDCVVHDSSDSGQTLYVEPTSIVEENNEIRELEASIRDEKLRILRELTSKLNAESKRLEETLKALAYLDLLYAKANYALSLNCTIPQINADGHVYMINARHPLLDQPNVVPIEMRFGERHQGVVITGPNTGGKTVSLKTVGLLTLMAQSGIPIPAAPDSKVSIFSKIFSDIGDEQSISQNLSTFSAHMKNIVGILSEVDHQTLVLIDELGAGTDPQEGAALGIAILRKLLDAGAKMVVTTHFSAIKHFAYQNEKLKTCSVTFDVETLSPTYRLVEGVGTSNAFVIAQRLGLAETMIGDAQSFLTEGQIRVEDIIRQLQEEREDLRAERERVAQRQQEVDQKYSEYIHKLQAFEEKKESALRRELRQLDDLVREARGSLESAIHIAKQKAIDEAQLRQALQKTVELNQQLNEAEKQLNAEPAQTPLAFSELREGFKIIFRGSKKIGSVRQAIAPNRIEADLDGLRIWTKLGDLVRAPEAKPEERPTLRPTVELSPGSTPELELHVRGMSASEAIREVDLYLDKCLLAGFSRGFIVHGKGTGVLRQEIRKHLTNLRHVKKFYSAPHNEGGDGITVVELAD